MPHRLPCRPWSWIAAALVVLSLAACNGGGEGDEGGDDVTDVTDVTDITTEPPPSANIRREIHSFAPPQVQAYAQGVARMKTRPASDPTSWIYQASMHGYPDSPQTLAICPSAGPPQQAWATCQHGSFFFLAWHRMYLYYFERILRAAVREAAGDPNYEFALPYWDYENADHRDLPEPFRDPADASNPLFVAQRVANCNDGSECVSETAASDEVAMDAQHTSFCSCRAGQSCPGCVPGLSGDETFAGRFTPAPNHNGSGPGELEFQPHGAVHVAVGGDTGWMSYFECAARDPIFWLHHANIDRLWQVWLNQTGGRANPLGSEAWKTQQFTFFDESKQAVTMTGCEILDTISQLDYQYDGLPVNNVTLCDDPTPPTAAPGPPPPAPKTLAAGAAAPVQLGRAPSSVTVPVPPAARQRILAVAGPEAPGRLRLVIEGLRLLRPGVPYHVYLNLPEGARPDPAGPHFVGNVALFAHPGHEEVTRSFDVTDEVQALRQAGQWTGDLRVTFVPGHREREMAAAGAQPFFSFRRVSIVERQPPL